MGSELLRGRADPVRLRSALDFAGPCDERDAPCLPARQPGGSVSAGAAAACDGLVQRPQPRRWPELAARSAATDRQTQFCRPLAAGKRSAIGLRQSNIEGGASMID